MLRLISIGVYTKNKKEPGKEHVTNGFKCAYAKNEKEKKRDVLPFWSSDILQEAQSTDND